jgi:hypothetical protein
MASTDVSAQQVNAAVVYNKPVGEPGKNDASSSSTAENAAPGLYKDLSSSLEIRRHQVRGRGIWAKQVFKRGESKIPLSNNKSL